MKENLKKGICGFFTVVLAGFAAWLFWGPLLSFLFSLIPEAAPHAWVGKLLAVGLVGWVGGIGVPIIILVLGIGVTSDI